VAGAAASETCPVFDLYLLARLSVQEAVDGESLDDQVSLGKRDAAAVLGIEQDRIAFVDADPDAIRDRSARWLGSARPTSLGARPGSSELTSARSSCWEEACGCSLMMARFTG
jgi:hypothetical protein